MNRCTYQDNGVELNPLASEYTANSTSNTISQINGLTAGRSIIYRMEDGVDADGSALTAYIQSGDGDSGKTVFESPVRATYIDRGNQYLNNLSTVRIKPQDGLLVIFPSYLNHYQSLYKGTEDRIVIAFNASIDKREEN